MFKYYSPKLGSLLERINRYFKQPKHANGALIFAFPLGIFLLAIISACDSFNNAGQGAVNAFIKADGRTMGTTYSVQIDRLPEGMNIAELLNQFETRLRAFTQLYSTYEKGSLISGFNESISTDWFAVPAGFVTQVSIADRISRASDGAFDITMQPLVQVWGFGSTFITQKPDDAKIQTVLENTGYQHIQVREAPPAIRKDKPQLEIDLSSIAKGTAIDELADWLNGLHVENWLIEIGGELRAKGFNRDKQPWQIGIQRPNSTALQADIVLPLMNEAVATSGDYENYFVEDGVRYSHILNPATGYPVTHQTTSVSVIAKSTAMADAWATVLLVMGKEEGMVLAEEESIAAIFIEHDNGGFLLTATPAMQAQKNLAF